MGWYEDQKKFFKKVKEEPLGKDSNWSDVLTAVGTGGLSLLAPKEYQDDISDIYMGGAAAVVGGAALGTLFGAGAAGSTAAGTTAATSTAATGGSSLGTGAAILGSSAIGGISSYLSGERTADAATDAAVAQQLAGEKGATSIKEGTTEALSSLEAGRTGAVTAQEEALQNILSAQQRGAEGATEAQEQASLEAQQTLGASKDELIAQQQQVFAQQQAINQPWQQAGLEALDKYSNMPEFSFTAEDFTADPSYEFRKQEGITALDRSAAARGRVLSGGQDRAVTRYASDLASQEYANAYSRAFGEYGTEMDRQLNIANLGSQATGRTSAAAGQMGSTIGGAISQTGTNLANLQQQEGVNISNILSADAAAQASAYGQQGSNLANIYQGYGQNVANLQSQEGANLANIYAGMGAAQAQGITGAAQAEAQGLAGVGSAVNTGISNALLYNYLS